MILDFSEENTKSLKTPCILMENSPETENREEPDERLLLVEVGLGGPWGCGRCGFQVRLGRVGVKVDSILAFYKAKIHFAMYGVGVRVVCGDVRSI